MRTTTRVYEGQKLRAKKLLGIPIPLIGLLIVSGIVAAATMLGPAFGGVLYALFRGPSAVYATSALLATTALITTFRIKPEATARPREPLTFATVFAGLRFIWREKLILGAISLDLFAVLLGGAVALLPVYAREILRGGPQAEGTSDYGYAGNVS